MADDKAKVLARCFGYIALGVLAGFVLPIVLFFAIYHNATGGALWRISLISICMPSGAIVGLAKALKDWRAFAAAHS
ncbi:hypothetical protein SAMN05421819_2242 [Bryocella elongata]|uniref:Uncharacterized protein n=1 Tax=Bryocella elongata TaxID=863522 RepID=A0A1H5YCQ2_9BACT|nr:hypothetical protein [Bryocella elongata]SEG21788.1 hypothetical protein SAMN05421819_2242 [Bryocella elongata]